MVGEEIARPDGLPEADPRLGDPGQLPPIKGEGRSHATRPTSC